VRALFAYTPTLLNVRLVVVVVVVVVVVTQRSVVPCFLRRPLGTFTFTLNREPGGFLAAAAAAARGPGERES